MFKEKLTQKIFILATFALLVVLALSPDSGLKDAYLIFACLIEILFIISVGLYNFTFSILYFIVSCVFLFIKALQPFSSPYYYFNLAAYFFVGYLMYFTIHSTAEESHGNISFIKDEEENLLMREKELQRMQERKKVMEVQTRQLQYLSGMLNQAWSLTSFDELAAFFVRQTSKMFSDTPVVLSIRDLKISKDYRTKSMHGLESAPSGSTVSSMPSIVSESKKPFLIEDIDREILYKIIWSHKDGPGFKSVMAVPVEINERFSAVLECYNSKSGGFNNNLLRILQYIGEMLAILLLNAMLYEETEKLARTDGITGMFVQRYFIEKIQEEIFRARKQNSKFSLMIVDIDNFKEFNDTYGHQVGDFVLIKTAHLIGTDMRTIDFASRYGGDEFFIILPETDLEGARQAAERIRQNVFKETGFLSFEGRRIARNITVSIGVDEYRPEYGDYKQFIDRVDRKLYEAKKLGKNRVVWEDGHGA